MAKATRSLSCIRKPHSDKLTAHRHQCVSSHSKNSGQPLTHSLVHQLANVQAHKRTNKQTNNHNEASSIEKQTISLNFRTHHIIMTCLFFSLAVCKIQIYIHINNIIRYYVAVAHNHIRIRAHTHTHTCTDVFAQNKTTAVTKKMWYESTQTTRWISYVKKNVMRFGKIFLWKLFNLL